MIYANLSLTVESKHAHTYPEQVQKSRTCTYEYQVKRTMLLNVIFMADFCEE